MYIVYKRLMNKERHKRWRQDLDFLTLTIVLEQSLVFNVQLGYEWHQFWMYVRTKMKFYRVYLVGKFDTVFWQQSVFCMQERKEKLEWK